MPKNIVVCLDGTADFAAQNPTHVFRLFHCLERSPNQAIYYDGGVGTLRDAHELSWIGKRWNQVLDLAAGFSVRDHCLEAYEFLCKTYEDGDKVFLFGFSRGAYTARVLAGCIGKFGIPYPAHMNILPYLWQSISEVSDMGEETSRFFNRLKGAFGRSAPVAFIGVWDTVSAFGLGKLRTIPQTSKLDAAQVVRHAVSIDERRNMFPENLITQPDPKTGKDFQEVWFAGVHRDVGGGGNCGTLGLSRYSFDWVANEAIAHGLLIDSKRSHWFDDDPCAPDHTPGKITPNACQPNNNSPKQLKLYAIFGLIPMQVLSDKEKKFVWSWLNFSHLRPIPYRAKVHVSVKERMESCNIGYRPQNVVDAKDIEWFPPPAMPAATPPAE